MRLPIFLRYLVFFFPILIVSFAVFMGGSAIARMADDKVACWVMNSAAVATLLALAVDVILLVGALGLKSLMDVDRQQHEHRRRERRRRKKRHGRGPGRGGRGRGRRDD